MTLLGTVPRFIQRDRSLEPEEYLIYYRRKGLPVNALHSSCECCEQLC